jgi:hypothetical protein
MMVLPEDSRHAVAFARALEFTAERVKEVTEEARKRGCFFYKSHRDKSSGIISLHFADGADASFRRTVNCNQFFKADGLHSEFEASLIRADIDALVLESGEFMRVVGSAISQKQRRGPRNTVVERANRFAE